MGLFLDFIMSVSGGKVTKWAQLIHSQQLPEHFSHLQKELEAKAIYPHIFRNNQLSNPWKGCISTQIIHAHN